VSVLGVRVIKDELRSAELSGDDKWLHSRGMPSQPALHTALHVMLVVLQVSYLNSVGNPSRRILITLYHIGLTPSRSEYLLLLVLQ